ncbi:hypothetical protein PC128_g25878, partial [Phytophthora cactorum]
YQGRRVLVLKWARNLDNIAATYQTAAFFEYLPSKTLNGKEEKTVWVRCGGKSKERATVMILGDPKSGTKFALPSKMRMFKSTVTEKGWWNISLSV